MLAQVHPDRRVAPKDTVGVWPWLSPRTGAPPLWPQPSDPGCCGEGLRPEATGCPGSGARPPGPERAAPVPVTSPHVHRAQASPPGRADATRDPAGCFRVSRLCSASPSAAARGASAGAARPGRAAAAAALWAEGCRHGHARAAKTPRPAARVRPLRDALRNCPSLCLSRQPRCLLGARRDRAALVVLPDSACLL